MKKITTIFLLVLVSSCSTRPLTEKERAVRIIRESDAPEKCIEKGMVYAQSMSGLTFEGIENQMKIDTFSLGADTLALVHNGANGYKAGKAYKCKKD